MNQIRFDKKRQYDYMIYKNIGKRLIGKVY